MDRGNSYLCQFILSIVWSIIISVAEECNTPLGKLSKCVRLYDCPQIAMAFAQRPLSANVIAFLKKSHCGFEDDLPKVCCGPLPVENNPPTTPQVTTQSSNETDTTFVEDSSPAPMNKCGFDTEGGLNNRVYGGRSTYLDEFPWMALLGYRTESDKITYKCGGAIINRRYVLTAAHCITGAIEKIIGKLFTVRLGEYDTKTDPDCIDGLCADPPQEFPVHSAYPHPGYGGENRNRRDDIGIIRLSRRVKYSDYIQPICLADSNAVIADGSEVYVAGWGQTLKGQSSSVKLKLTFPIFNKSECNKKYKTEGAELTEKQICAGGALNESACKGDSGGPIMRRRSEGVWESIGIVSFGYGCGREGWPGVSTSVAGYKDWILSMLKSTNV